MLKISRKIGGHFLRKRFMRNELVHLLEKADITQKSLLSEGGPFYEQNYDS